ncbi:PD-(D/E)XK nuclease family transposase [Eubacteriaceae bacterium CHKCI004]|nr:PD-(D/E)XK nuclease family transposase [Eubacteriaceae bacterium CHKCI004]
MKGIDQCDRETFPDEELENRYQRYREIIKNFTLLSDTFMRNVFKHIECVEYVLQVIMGRKDLCVVDSVVQKDYKNLQGRSAILDCVARDVENKRYDVEVQQKNEGASPKRSRYHSGLVDMNTLEAGHEFEELPDSYVIFITRGDVLGYGLPISKIERTIGEIGADFGDGSYIIYVNAAMKDEKTELGRLMHDFHCKDADEMYSEVLARRVRELKETEEGVRSMCQEMDEIYNEGMMRGEKRGITIGEERGEKKAKKETALSLAEMGLPVEQIARGVKESVSIVQAWITEAMTVVK